MVARRLSAEQMSRVLGEHAAGYLSKGGAVLWSRDGARKKDPVCCPLQAAANDTSLLPGVLAIRGRLDGDRAALVAAHFDTFYRPTMTPEELIDLLDAEEVQP